MADFELTPLDDRLVGTSGDDQFEGLGGGIDTLFGGAGNDTFRLGDDGAVRCYGEADDDTFFIDARSARDPDLVIDGGSGYDVLKFTPGSVASGWC